MRRRALLLGSGPGSEHGRCLRLLLVLNYAWPFDSANVDKRWGLEQVSVSSQVVLLLLLEYGIDLLSNLFVDIVHENLLLPRFLDSQLHETKCLSDDFPIELQLNLFPLDPLVLLLDLNGEEVHHVITLLDLLELLGELVLQEPDGFQTSIEFVELRGELLLILLCLLL